MKSATDRHVAAVRRRHRIEAAGLAAFVLTVGALALHTRPIDAFLVSFIVYAIAYCVFVVWRLSAAPLKDLPQHSANHDESAAVILLIGVTLVAAAMVIVALALMGGVKTIGGAVLVGGAVLSAWTLLHVIFAIHYAHAYYADIDGCAEELRFPDGAPSHFSDFLYFAFVLGMTFQVSDVVVAGSRTRRLVLAHSLLAFLLNVFVLSLTVTAVGGVL